MVTFFDDLTVGVLLAASMTYAVYSLGPKTWRQRLLAMLGSVVPGSMGRRLQLAATTKAAGSCGGCDGCGSAEKTATTATAANAPSANTAAGSAAARPGEVRIPLSQIGKRQAR
jgi:hypothetical protein